jgi:16S rRNA (cytosine1402-N4)-methyltransferase
MVEEQKHIPVLLNKVIEVFEPEKGKIFVDCTLGCGGHAEQILKHSGKLIGIDQDTDALDIAKERLKEFGDDFIAVKDNFINIKQILEDLNIEKVIGILADLGVSSIQLDNFDKGFSFMTKGPLDMRMDKDNELTAEVIVNSYPEKDLADLIFLYGEERRSRKIAKNIVEYRRKQRIKDTLTLAKVVSRAFFSKKSKINPATRTFQAIRIAVNKELDNLETFLNEAVELLEENGRLCVISYHSLEDRIVKHTFKEFAKLGFGKILTKKPVIAEYSEIRENRRSRSAKLRVFEKSGK